MDEPGKCYAEWISQTQNDKYLVTLYVKSSKAELRESESRMIIARVWGVGGGLERCWAKD
jgi:hypothetical protein